MNASRAARSSQLAAAQLVARRFSIVIGSYGPETVRRDVLSAQQIENHNDHRNRPDDDVGRDAAR
jgi:hypothetical protein